MPTTPSCPFCTPDPDALLVPRRHIPAIAQATPAERAALFDLLDPIRRRLDDQYHPAGYNIGINDGQATGQTVPHMRGYIDLADQVDIAVGLERAKGPA